MLRILLRPVNRRGGRFAAVRGQGSVHGVAGVPMADGMVPGARARVRRSSVTSAAVAEAVTDPELRELIARAPLWRRPGYLVRRLHQIHGALFLAECGAHGITPVQYGLLTTLSGSPDADLNTLAAAVGLDRTNVADVLDRLARRGLVQRRRGRADRRTVLARLTPEGERVTRAMLGAMRRAQDRLLEPLDAAERDLFMTMLLRLVDANNEHGRAVLGAVAG